MIVCQGTLRSQSVIIGKWDYEGDMEVNESPHEKTHDLVSEQVLHERTCTVSEKGKKLQILDLRRRGVVLSV